MVTVLNPDHHLFTLQDDREINVVLYVNKGRGFVPAEQHVLPKSSPVDMVRVDSIYNPVLRANFTVDETRVGQRTDFDRLMKDAWRGHFEAVVVWDLSRMARSTR